MTMGTDVFVDGGDDVCSLFTLRFVLDGIFISFQRQPNLVYYVFAFIVGLPTYLYI